jgi:hypothetical protein
VKGNRFGPPFDQKTANLFTVLQVALIKLKQHDPKTAMAARQALWLLAGMIPTRKAGRPAKNTTSGVWLDNTDELTFRVAHVLKDLDRDDETTITTAQSKLERLATELISPAALSAPQKRQLQKMLAARSAKPSVIVRTLQQWQFGLSDRAIRRLRRQRMSEFHWL